MKKIYTVLAALGVTASMAAQQLPNAGFEDGWKKCEPYTGGGTTTAGQTPESWTIASVAGTKVFSWMGTTIVGESTTGCNSATAVLLKNSPNSMVSTQTVPGYITLGTSWNTANLQAKEKDGGSFGGIEFAYRPDAICFDYQRGLAGESAEQASVVAYSWCGSTTQVDVPVSIGSKPTKVSMTDRDRNILSMETAKGGEVTYSQDFKLVSKIDYAINGAQNEWLSLSIPFEYFDDANPTKINVIFGSGNYFSTDPEQGNTLTIDNVKLVYYSRLSGIKFKGTDIEGFDPDNFEYELDEIMPTDEKDIEVATMGNSGVAKAEVALDPQKNVATITVSNDHGADADNLAKHVYTVKFLPAGSSIADTSADAADNVRYYNLQGNIVDVDALVSGQTYIKVANGVASKIIK